MATKVEAKALEISEEIIEKAVEKISSAAENIPVREPVIGWKPIAIGCAIAGGLGIVGYFAGSKIEDFIISRKFKKMCRNNKIESKNDESLTKTPESYDYSDIVIPPDLDNSLETLNNVKEPMSDLLQRYKNIAFESSSINPPIEIQTNFDDFEDRIDGYTQKIIMYIESDDTPLFFDEIADKFVVLDLEDIFQGAEYCIDAGITEVFVANHDDEIVYDIQMDAEHTLQEVLDDANESEYSIDTE